MSVTVFWREWEEKQPDSHELLRLALEQYFGRTPVDLEEDQDQKQKCMRDAVRVVLKKLKKGKPYFENLPQVKFSISHSGNFWACAFCDAEVGFDLQGEYKKNGEKLARRFFHPEEIAWLERDGFAQFGRVWAHKESFVKFTGEGLTRGLDYFSVVPWLEENEWKFSCMPSTSDGMLRGNVLKTAGNDVSGGGVRICQQEIPFREGFWMVLTSNAPQMITVRSLF